MVDRGAADDEPVRGAGIDATLARELVAQQFPQWADLPVTGVQVDGNDNRTFRLGSDLSVRLPSAEAYAAQVAKEHQWLPFLAPRLPLPVPVPVALGAPGAGYPWSWSVYRWLDGEVARTERIGDLGVFATSLARFLASLHRIDPAGGPAPGRHNFFRGGALETYDAETRSSIRAVGDLIDADAATSAWEAALAAPWQGTPVWFHGDVAASNLLVRRGRLSAVIDFGCSGVGDPACDLVIAWTMLTGQSREAFRAALPLDAATWARGRGWALWKGLITVAEHRDTNPAEATAARRVLEQVLADHRRFGRRAADDLP